MRPRMILANVCASMKLANIPPIVSIKRVAIFGVLTVIPFFHILRKISDSQYLRRGKIYNTVLPLRVFFIRYPVTK